MGIEFRLGRQDHPKVEDFLGTRPKNVDGIWVEAGNVTRQLAAIEQARATGVEVLVEPMTERLADPGFTPGNISYAQGGPLDLGRLSRSRASRSRLVEAVVATQTEATIVTTPHFYVWDEHSAQLNLDLAAETAELADADVRAILLAKRDHLANPEVAADLAMRYADIGITSMDLRLSPLGANNDGSIKVHSALGIIDAFNAEGISVNLGLQGQLGQTALALGIVSGFSVGIGVRESIDHGAAITAQQKPRSKNEKFFGVQPGIWLHGPDIAVPRRVAKVLLSDPSIRSRLVCSIGQCSASMSGPLADARTHYLHSRSAEVATLLSRPMTWRASHEEDRLVRAIDMRAIVNEHLPSAIDETPVHPLKTRLLEVLVAEIAWRQQGEQSA